MFRNHPFWLLYAKPTQALHFWLPVLQIPAISIFLSSMWYRVSVQPHSLDHSLGSYLIQKKKVNQGFISCLLSLEDCYPTISVVQCLRAIASYILPNFIVASGRRVTTVSYPIMARSRIPFNVSLDFYSYVIKSKAERLKLKLLDLMHLKRNN